MSQPISRHNRCADNAFRHEPWGASITHRTAIIVALCASMLAACDTIHGIRRTASFDLPVDWDCVQTAIEGAHPGTEITVRQSDSEGFGISPNWGSYIEENRYLTYTIPDTPGIVLQSTKRNGETTSPWSQYLISINRGVEKPVIEKLRAAMLTTEHAVSARCGVDFSEVTERVD